MEFSLFNSFLLVVVWEHTCVYMGGTRYGTPGLDTCYEKGGEQSHPALKKLR